jgi:hypothetical protein
MKKYKGLYGEDLGRPENQMCLNVNKVKKTE